MPHKRLSDLKAFKSWAEATEDFSTLLKDFIDGLAAEDKIGKAQATGIMKMTVFMFQMSLTAENERRKKR